MKRKSDLEAAKESKRVYLRAYHARRYADPEYRARKLRYYAEKRADPNGTPSTKRSSAGATEPLGSSWPTANASRQRAYAKLAANSEWRGREKYAFLFSIALETAAMFAMMVADSARPPIAEPPRLVVNNYPPVISLIRICSRRIEAAKWGCDRD